MSATEQRPTPADQDTERSPIMHIYWRYLVSRQRHRIGDRALCGHLASQDYTGRAVPIRDPDCCVVCAEISRGLGI